MKKIGLLLLLASSVYAQSDAGIISIYRWNYGNDWVDAKEDEAANMIKFGYKNQTFVCKLFAEPKEGTIPISRWLNAKTGDWVSVAESASADMQRFGYTSKVLLGYAYPNKRPNSYAIYRWELPSTGDWVTVPGFETDKMLEFGYTHKTFVAFTPF